MVFGCSTGCSDQILILLELCVPSFGLGAKRQCCVRLDGRRTAQATPISVLEESETMRH